MYTFPLLFPLRIWSNLANVSYYLYLRTGGVVQDFHLEGAQKNVCAHAHYERKVRSAVHVRPGSMAHLRPLATLGFFHALSRYLSLTFMCADTKWDLKNCRSNRGRPLPPPPSCIRHWRRRVMSKMHNTSNVMCVKILTWFVLIVNLQKNLWT